MNNIEYFTRLLGNFFEYKTGKIHCRFLPTSIFLETTNVCNLKCIMCPNKEIPQSEKGFMDFDFFKKIINEASSFARYINLFVTGEPFAHPQISEMTHYAKSKDLKVKIHTNGTLLNEKIARELINGKLDILSISFDGYNSETYNSIRKNADFEVTLGKIKEFLEIKKNLGAKKPFTIIQTILLDGKKINDTEEKRFEQLFNGLPVDRFSKVLPIRWPMEMNMNGNNAGNALSKYQPCIDPWFTMSILWNGDIVPCCGDYSGAYVIGNASEINLREAWNNDKITALRRNLINRPSENISPEKTLITLCGNCERLFEKKMLGIPVRNWKYFLKERFHLK